jgi:hypothetical protein
VPVIEPSTLELLIVDLKPKGLDQVKRRARCRTSAGNISRVLRNFGLMKNNVDLFHTVILLFLLLLFYPLTSLCQEKTEYFLKKAFFLQNRLEK